MIRSPNIWDTPDVYELENRAADRVGVLERAIDALYPWDGADVLDLGCGTGFHLPRLAARGARVVGVEPHLPLVARGRERLARMGWPAALVAGEAEAIPLRDCTLDILQARWAYFFGAGCEPGLAEARRVLRPGGIIAVIDNDTTRSTFGRWFRRAYPAYDPVAVQRFWDRQGFTTEAHTIEWTFDRRDDLEAVVQIELPPSVARTVLDAHQGLTVDYGVALRWRRY